MATDTQQGTRTGEGDLSMVSAPLMCHESGLGVLGGLGMDEIKLVTILQEHNKKIGQLFDLVTHCINIETVLKALILVVAQTEALKPSGIAARLEKVRGAMGSQPDSAQAVEMLDDIIGLLSAPAPEHQSQGQISTDPSDLLSDFLKKWRAGKPQA